MGKYFRFFHVYPPKMKIVVTVFALHLQKKNGHARLSFSLVEL